MRKIINTDNAPKPLGAYSQGVAAGSFIFVSGQLAMDSDTGKLIEGDIKQQTRQVFRNIEQILAAQGAGFQDIVKISAFLLHIEDFQGMNEVFREIFPENLPARTTTTVKTFPPGVLIEIDAIAIVQS